MLRIVLEYEMDLDVYTLGSLKVDDLNALRRDPLVRVEALDSGPYDFSAFVESVQGVPPNTWRVRPGAALRVRAFTLELLDA